MGLKQRLPVDIPSEVLEEIAQRFKERALVDILEELALVARLSARALEAGLHNEALDRFPRFAEVSEATLRPALARGGEAFVALSGRVWHGRVRAWVASLS